MIIHGINKLTLLDYPTRTACTLFSGGCNFRCPFCHNASLVLDPGSQPIHSEQEIFDFLLKRKNVLEGVCITGGEPTLDSDLASFIYKIKEMGYLVKLDTNGYRPDVLKSLLDEKLIDYVAMDIKNSPDKYKQTVGLKNFDIAPIKKSVTILMSDGVDYEFRTTVVKEFHDKKSFIDIATWLQGAKRYFLQPFRDGEDLISSGLGNHTDEELSEFLNILTPFFGKVAIRGKN